MSDIIERGAEAMRAKRRELINQPLERVWPDLMRAALDAIARDKKANCKHMRKNGTGQVCSDGSSKTTWFCLDCGASGEMETPARAVSLPAHLW